MPKDLLEPSLDAPALVSAPPALQRFDRGSWAVAWTKPRCEKVLAELLLTRAVPHFLPVLQKRRRYDNRVRVSELPLFPSYVFFDQEQFPAKELYATRKVAQILAPDDPLQLRCELGHLARALQHDDTLVEARFGEPGRRVQIVRGPLKGLEGELVRYGTAHRLVIKVTFLGKAAAMDIDEAFVEPLL